MAKDVVTSIPSDIAETLTLRGYFSQLSVVQIYKNVNCDKHAQQGKATEQFYLKNICKSFLLAADYEYKVCDWQGQENCFEFHRMVMLNRINEMHFKPYK